MSSIKKLYIFAVVVAISFSICFAQSVSMQQKLEPDIFLKKWLITEPIPAAIDSAERDFATQRAWFETQQFDVEQITNGFESGEFVIDSQPLTVQSVNAEQDIIDLTKFAGEQEFATVFAYCKVTVDENKNVLFGLGSDDAVRMWVNKKLVHQNFTGRAVAKDQDLVEATLRRGANTILLQVYNRQMGWGFALRPLGQEAFSELFLTSAAQGDLQQLELLIKYGADPNAAVGPGLTPLYVATIRGQKHVVKWLKEQNVRETDMPDKGALIDYMLERAARENYPGAAVLVAKDGEIVYQSTVGYANIEKKAPIELETKFRIGSITKQFTASAILKLQEQGTLSVNDKLSTYFDFPRGDEVTIHHLLTHTSGIHSFTSTPDFLEKVVGPNTREEMLQWIESLSYDFDPGEAWSYNNSGYYLLGLIIEKVNGQSFGESLADLFFEPLDMNNTGVHSPGIDLEKEALGYQYDNGEIKPAVDWNMDFAGGAGNLYSTVLDLHKWNEAVFHGNVLSAASKQMAFTPVVLNDSEQAAALGGGYGYGWAISTNRGLRVIQHGGGLNGFNSSLARFPEHDLTIVVLSNALPNIPDLNPGGLTNQIAELYLYPFMDAQEPPQVATDFDPKLLEDYVGRYDYQSGIMTIRREGDQLFAQLSGQQEYEIYPSAKDRFFWKVVDAQIDFKRDETGTVTHAIHKQNNTELKVPKLKNKNPITLPVDVLQKYVGKYELAPNALITITQDNNSLYAQITGQPKLEIFPSDENVFFYKDVNAQLTFNTADDGTVQSVTIDQGPVNREAKRIKE